MLRRQAELKVQALAANLENAVTVLLTDLVRRESREDVYDHDRILAEHKADGGSCAD
jgi:hypothetical protein